MPNLKFRSNTKELLDADDISFEDIKCNMKELNIINTLLGGHSITIKGINNFKSKNEALNVCEIGCGGGDNINAISKANNTHFNFTGVDLKKECIDFAKQQYFHLNATWIACDYSKVIFEKKPDVIFSSLFCHHFTEEQLIFMLKWMKENSVKGFFINDLQRSIIAYFLIKWLTSFFSKSLLVKNDAPLSVARGFHKKEWNIIFEKAGITDYSIKWKWAFRYLIVCKNA